MRHTGYGSSEPVRSSMACEGAGRRLREFGGHTRFDPSDLPEIQSPIAGMQALSGARLAAHAGDGTTASNYLPVRNHKLTRGKHPVRRYPCINLRVSLCRARTGVIERP